MTEAAHTHEVAVHCAQVTKSYFTGPTEVKALRGVDLDVYTGELLMLVGPSGCGKTTLISVMAGILDHDGGDLSVFGKDVRTMSQFQRTHFRGEHIGFVFQAFNLIPSLTSTENVAVPLLILGEGWHAALEKARTMLASVGLEDQYAKLPSQLSGGQQQRVAIARAMIHEPRFIVCDEPTSALDYETGVLVMDVLRNQALAPDRALVIVTHDSRIFNYADRIARMDDGCIVRIETGDEIRVSRAGIKQPLQAQDGEHSA